MSSSSWSWIKTGTIPEKVWFMIKETDGVGDFIGSNGKPIADVRQGRGQDARGRRAPRREPIQLDDQFKKGEKVKVTNGAS